MGPQQQRNSSLVSSRNQRTGGNFHLRHQHFPILSVSQQSYSITRYVGTIDFVIEGRASTAIRPVKLTRSITPLSLSVTALTMEPITGSYAIRGDVHGAATAMFSFKEVLTCATLQLSLLFLISRKFILKYLKLSHYYSL